MGGGPGSGDFVFKFCKRLRSVDWLSKKYNSKIMHIRPARKEEFDVIAHIYKLSKLDELRFENRQFQLLPLEKDERRLQELLECTIFVYDKGSILGYGAFFKDQIRAIYVHPDAREKGIGTELLEYLLTRTMQPARLFIAKSNSPARKLYERYGFQTIDEFETTYNGVSVLANEMIRVFQNAR